MQRLTVLVLEALCCACQTPMSSGGDAYHACRDDACGDDACGDVACVDDAFCMSHPSRVMLQQRSSRSSKNDILQIFGLKLGRTSKLLQVAVV